MNVDQSRLDALRGGQLDWADAIPLQHSTRSSATARSPTSARRWPESPTSSPQHQETAVQQQGRPQAVAWALDRDDEIRKVAYFGAGETGSLEVRAARSGTAATTSTRRARNWQGQALLKQAGHANGLTIAVSRSAPVPRAAEDRRVVRATEEDRITMNIKQVDVSVWFDRFSKGAYQITSATQNGRSTRQLLLARAETGGPINTTAMPTPGSTS